jgi:hypothetical protein
MLGLTPSKNFTTKSLYKLLTDGGVTSRLARKLWKCNIPLKIKVLLWQAFQNRLQTGQLKERNWKSDGLCALCGAREDVDHLLFKCPLAEFLWAFVSEALAWGAILDQ